MKFIRPVAKKIRINLSRHLPQPVKRIIRRILIVPAKRLWFRHIPTAMITGTKGKTTTTRMLAHILSEAGSRVGFTSTDGIVINGHYINRWDASGYWSAHRVLNDPSINAAVLETGRGGILKNGLYIDSCDVAALLNVGREQIGIDGIDTVEQMAALKQRVINAARGAVVLNADDVQCCKLIGQYPSHRVVLFSLQAESAIVQEHIQKGGTAYILDDSNGEKYIERLDSNAKQFILAINDLPSCRNGLFPQNIANAMAAAALAEGMSVPMDTIKKALKSFQNSIQHSPGRLNFLDGYSQTILLDHATSIPACTALVDSVSNIDVSGRRICMFAAVGNRPEWHYTELGEILGPHFDHFICYEQEHYLRGRKQGEILKLLQNSLINAGVPMDHIDTAYEYSDATKRLSQWVREQDLAVILINSSHEYLPIFRKHFAVHKLRNVEGIT